MPCIYCLIWSNIKNAITLYLLRNVFIFYMYLTIDWENMITYVPCFWNKYVFFFIAWWQLWSVFTPECTTALSCVCVFVCLPTQHNASHCLTVLCARQLCSREPLPQLLHLVCVWWWFLLCLCPLEPTFGCYSSFFVFDDQFAFVSRWKQTKRQINSHNQTEMKL